MTRLALFATTVLLAAAVPDDIIGEFNKFAKKWGKNYGAEYDIRLNVFAANLRMNEKIKAQRLGFELAITQFADRTGAEIAALYPVYTEKPNVSLSLGMHRYSGVSLPDSVDWTTQGAVTPVKNQEHCGGCWAFATTGALEGAWQIATGNLVVLSEEQLLDCDFDTGDMGCSGGLATRAFNYTTQHDVCSEAAYPTNVAKWNIGVDCKEDTCYKKGAPGIPKGGVTGFTAVDSNEQALMEAVAQGPVATGVAADKDIFHLYTKGILQGKGCGNKIDHAVLVVGYGADNGVKYWKVKNSWGPTWGEGGYVRVIRGVDECGILDLPPAYPVVRKVDALVINV
eukprot:CAMPEP_0179223740 /NCGR_PEP_ID=MMETSP0797-20121207/7403_1 /TAXON_ID=47934 /ORGANISM="Dinophysis acuminata, Strain DAEP01" /LENGTH=339 /DNA_ID=CAMNT_0020930645 /DNA_START=77 /DNA_END=1096 /DNA_ORIENTATION=+